ncbi:MAG: sigma-54 dependent transcriptional regulator [Nitrospirota bacterium]
MPDQALDSVTSRQKAKTFTILLVEDSASDTELLLNAIEEADLKAIKGDIDFEVRSSAEGALQALAERPIDLVLTDMMLPGIDGLDLVAKIQEIDRNLPVLVVTRVNEVPAAVDALRRGAYDYVLKPVNPDDLGMRLHRAIRISEILRRNTLYERVMQQELTENGLVGVSEAHRQILSRVREAVQGRAPVLIVGETGTGKGLIARMIHAESEERDKPYQVIDCTTLPEGMAESELFGHVRGAFTGAIADKPGLIELANGGTAFLDEIGDLPLPLQAKLLRVLEDNEVRPVGGTRIKRVDMRFIAATNQDLEEKIKTGAFRKDLFYRLAGIVIRVPPLRERPEDIPVIARHLVGQFGRELGKPDCALEPAALTELSTYSWPGNVRELRNVVERAVMLASGDRIGRSDVKVLLPESRKAQSAMDFSGYVSDTYEQGRKKILAEFTNAFLKAKLALYAGNVGKAAEHSGMTRQHFSFLMKRFLD